MATILIVDDDIHTIEQITLCLNPMGYQIETLSEPRLFFQMMADLPVDLVLMDIHLSQFDDRNLLKWMNAHPAYRAIPVIMMIADLDERMFVKRIERETIDFINKPIKNLALRTRVVSALNARNALQQLEEKILEYTQAEAKSNQQTTRWNNPSSNPIVYRILVVDDDPVVRETLVSILERKTSYQIETAAEGKEALEKWHQAKEFHTNNPQKFPCPQPYHLMIVDLRMPRMSGEELIQEICKTDQHVAILVLTAHGGLSEAYRLLEKYHISDFLDKPLKHPNELLFSVENALEKRQFEVDLKKAKAHVEQINRQLKKNNQLMTRELEQARNAQAALFPKRFVETSALKVAIKYEPTLQIGGDFYSMLPLDEHQTAIVLGDVSGHGVSAALISVIIFNLFNNIMLASKQIIPTVKEINEQLHQKLATDKHTTLFCCIYEAPTRTLTYCTQGHPCGYLISSGSQQIQPLKTQGGLIGRFTNQEMEQYQWLQEHTVQMNAGDRIFLYTDGLIEAMNEAGVMYGQNLLETFLSEHHYLGTQELINAVFSDALQYSGMPNYQDDLTLICLEVQ